MRIRHVVIVILFCVLFTFTSMKEASAEPSELKFDDTISGPYVDEVMYKIIWNENNRVQALLNDQIDILDGPISSSHLSTLEADPDIELSSTLRNGYGHLTINCRDYPTNVTEFRRAFAFAYDKYRVTSEVFDGSSQEQDSLVPYVSTFCIEDELTYHYYESDLVSANALLDDAGFLDTGDVDDWREAPDGSPFTIVIQYSQDSEAIAGATAQIGVDALRAIGINADAQATDFNAYISMLDSHEFGWDIVFYASNYYSNDVDWLASEYWSELATEPYQNPTMYQNATYDALRTQLLNGSTFEEVYNASGEMQKILHHSVPRLVVYENYYYSAYRTDRFNGHVVDISKNVENEWTNLKVHLNLLEGGPFSGTLRVSLAQEPDSFNLMTSNSAYSKMIFDNVFDSLIRTGPDGQRRMGLAQSYIAETHDENVAVPDGNTRFTFDILQNALWSDGTPLTADDIAYSFNYYKDSLAYGNPTGVHLADLVSAYSTTPSRVILEFSSESYWLIRSISDVVILQRTLLQSIGLSGWNTWNPVYSSDPFPTSGPFNLTKNSAGNYVILSHNPAFHHRVRGTGSGIPEATSPDDLFVVQGTSGHSISWTYADDNQLVYRIFNNSTIIEADYCSTSTVEFDVDAQLSAFGIYNFTFEVKDWEYQGGVDTVFVEYVSDSFAPEVTGPEDFSIGDVLSSGTFITWTVFDHNPANYTILLDGEHTASDDWIEGDTSISHDIGSLTEGEYNFTILLFDIYGQNSTNTVIVTVVIDLVPPELVGPEDFVMLVGDLESYIQWNVSDLYPHIFEINVETEVNTTSWNLPQGMTWESDVPIRLNLYDIPLGVYNFTIIVMDLGGNIVTDSVIVHVRTPGLQITELILIGIGSIATILVVAVIIIKRRT